jgi:hypothetical protein
MGDMTTPPTKRSLILAGGGVKVAFQAGVLEVWLDEAGLTFDHADGASDGVFNLEPHGVDRAIEGDSRDSREVLVLLESAERERRFASLPIPPRINAGKSARRRQGRQANRTVRHLNPSGFRKHGIQRRASRLAGTSADW